MSNEEKTPLEIAVRYQFRTTVVALVAVITVVAVMLGFGVRAWVSSDGSGALDLDPSDRTDSAPPSGASESPGAPPSTRLTPHATRRPALPRPPTSSAPHRELH